MNASGRLPVVHVSASREDHGGIQSTLRHHHARDAALGFESRFLSLFDRTANWPGACASLGCHGWMPVGTVWRRFAAGAAPWRESVVVYHDGWGIAWFAPLDSARRRVVFLHTERPHTDGLLRTFAPRVDGFLAVSDAFARRVRRVVPGFPEERIAVLPFPVEPPEWAASAAARPDRRAPLLLGYAGRVERGAKRLDRLPALIAALNRRGLDFRFEIMGDGSYLPALRSALARETRVAFLGWRTGAEFWRTLATWDAVVMLSDSEGFSRAVMECMSCGVIPVHPHLSPAAVELTGPAAEVGLYPPGDVEAAAGRIARLHALDAAQMRGLRAACAGHFSGRTEPRYEEVFQAFIRRMAALPPRAVAPRRAPWPAPLPLGIYTRIFPWHF